MIANNSTNTPSTTCTMAATLRPVPTVGDDESSVVYPAASPAVTPTDDPGAADSKDKTASVVNAVAGSDTSSHTTHKVPSTATSAADAVAHSGKCLAASGAAIHYANNPDNFIFDVEQQLALAEALDDLEDSVTAFNLAKKATAAEQHLVSRRRKLGLTESPEAARRRKRRCVDYGFNWMDTLGGPVALGSCIGSLSPSPSRPFWTLDTPGVNDEFRRRFPELDQR